MHPWRVCAFSHLQNLGSILLPTPNSKAGPPRDPDLVSRGGWAVGRDLVLPLSGAIPLPFFLLLPQTLVDVPVCSWLLKGMQRLT